MGLEVGWLAGLGSAPEIGKPEIGKEGVK